MAYMNWTTDLELGIEVIDAQHKRIVDYINALDGAIETNNKQDIIDVAEKVVNYTVEHFSYEETLLKKADYILIEPHIMVHKNFTAAAKKMRENVLGENYMSAAVKMRGELTIWLTNHIKKEDADYAEVVSHLFNKKSFLNDVSNFLSKKIEF